VSRHVEEEDRAVVPIRYFRSKQRYNNDKWKWFI
jgi:hypothetical protein